jgi:hypothetical protein
LLTNLWIQGLKFIIWFEFLWDLVLWWSIKAGYNDVWGFGWQSSFHNPLIN